MTLKLIIHVVGEEILMEYFPSCFKLIDLCKVKLGTELEVQVVSCVTCGVMN